jgi:hypothetical protein
VANESVEPTKNQNEENRYVQKMGELLIVSSAWNTKKFSWSRNKQPPVPSPCMEIQLKNPHLCAMEGSSEQLTQKTPD